MIKCPQPYCNGQILKYEYVTHQGFDIEYKCSLCGKPLARLNPDRRITPGGNQKIHKIRIGIVQ